MSKKEEWKKVLENKIASRNKMIAKTKELNKLAADAEEQNKKDKAKLFFLDNMPESVITERGESLYLFEMHDEERLNRFLPDVPSVNQEVKTYMTSGTSDSSEYLAISQTYRKVNFENTPYTFAFTPSEFESIEKVYTVFFDLAAETSNKQTLPDRLGKINRNLGDKFKVTIESYQKAKVELVGVDQAAIQMRSLLEQLWGGLLILVRKNISNEFKDSRFALSKEKHRLIIADALVADDIKRKEFILSLDKMAKIALEISDTEFGKNQLNKDIDKLNEIYTLWILTIDDVVNTIFSNLEIE